MFRAHKLVRVDMAMSIAPTVITVFKAASKSRAAGRLFSPGAHVYLTTALGPGTKILIRYLIKMISQLSFLRKLSDPSLSKTCQLSSSCATC